jgi:hypothetical protein
LCQEGISHCEDWIHISNGRLVDFREEVGAVETGFTMNIRSMKGRSREGLPTSRINWNLWSADGFQYTAGIVGCFF